MVFQQCDSYEELKACLPIITYWAKKGSVRFIPVGVMVKKMYEDKMYYYLPDDGSSPLGFIWWSTNKAGDIVTLEVICVHKELLGVGIGTELIELMEEKNPNAKLFRTKTKRCNFEARTFYQTVGYREVGLSDNEEYYCYEKIIEK